MHAPSLLIYLPIVCDIDRVMTLTLFGGNVHIDPLPGGLGLPLPSIFFAVLGLYWQNKFAKSDALWEPTLFDL